MLLCACVVLCKLSSIVVQVIAAHVDWEFFQCVWYEEASELSDALDALSLVFFVDCEYLDQELEMWDNIFKAKGCPLDMLVRMKIKRSDSDTLLNSLLNKVPAGKSHRSFEQSSADSWDIPLTYSLVYVYNVKILLLQVE